MDDLLIIIINLFVSIITAIIASFITAKLTLKYFFKQEIWLRKEKKYSEIIDRLCMLLNYYEKESANYVLIEDNNFTDDFISEYKKALTEMEKIRYSTGFIIKPEVNEIIDNMINDFALEGEELQGNHFAYIDRVSSIIKETIGKIIDIANTDLEIK